MPKNKYPTLQELIDSNNFKPEIHETVYGVAKSYNGWLHVYVTNDNEYYTSLIKLTAHQVFEQLNVSSFTYYLVRGYGGRF